MVVILSGIGTAVILPIGIWTLYLTYKAKLRPMQFVTSMFLLTTLFYLSFQTFWNEVLNRCQSTIVTIESLVDCNAGTPPNVDVGMLVYVNVGIVSQSLCFVFFNIGFLMFVFRYYTTAKSVDRILKGTAKRD